MAYYKYLMEFYHLLTIFFISFFISIKVGNQWWEYTIQRDVKKFNLIQIWLLHICQFNVWIFQGTPSSRSAKECSLVYMRDKNMLFFFSKIYNWNQDLFLKDFILFLIFCQILKKLILIFWVFDIHVHWNSFLTTRL